VDPQRDSRRSDLSSRFPDLSVVVPVYNEGENITSTLRGVNQALVGVPNEILVVYDFDEDDTIPVVKGLQAELPTVRPHRNRIGRGALNAMKAGFEASRAPHILVTMADGSDDPREIPAMLELARGGADVVAGSRYMRGGRQIGGPPLKRTMSRAAGLSLHWVGGLPVHDPTSNYKLYSRRLLDQVKIESTAGFELAIELTVKAHLLGMTVIEVPTIWRDRTAGQSRFHIRKLLPHYMHWYWVGMKGRFHRR
jgi:dolichol-phosphate mannosyltransferase